LRIFCDTGLKRCSGFFSGFGINKIVLLVNRGVEGNLITALFELEVYGHAAAEKIGVLVITDDVWGTHPFVSGCDAAAVVGDVLAGLVLDAEKTADVVEDSGIVRPIDNQRGFVVASRQVFCGVDKVVVGAWYRLGGSGKSN